MITRFGKFNWGRHIGGTAYRYTYLYHDMTEQEQQSYLTFPTTSTFCCNFVYITPMPSQDIHIMYPCEEIHFEPILEVTKTVKLDNINCEELDLTGMIPWDRKSELTLQISGGNYLKRIILPICKDMGLINIQIFNCPVLQEVTNIEKVECIEIPVKKLFDPYPFSCCYALETLDLRGLRKISEKSLNLTLSYFKGKEVILHERLEKLIKDRSAFGGSRKLTIVRD